MRRLLGLLAACLISSAIAFGQGTATEQSPVTSGTQAKTLYTNPNGNGTVPSTTQGGAQSRRRLPRINRCPATRILRNAATGDAGANGQAMRPNPSQSGTPGTVAGNAPNGRDNTDSKINRNGAGKNPVNGSARMPSTNLETFSAMEWFWLIVAFLVGLIVIGVLASRRRAREESYSGLATPRRDDQIRKAG